MSPEEHGALNIVLLKSAHSPPSRSSVKAFGRFGAKETPSLDLECHSIETPK